MTGAALLNTGNAEEATNAAVVAVAVVVLASGVSKFKFDLCALKGILNTLKTPGALGLSSQPSGARCDPAKSTCRGYAQPSTSGGVGAI